MLNRQKGFTLVELMVGLTLGLTVIAGVFDYFSTIIRANAEAVKQQQFEQAAQALASTMSADIRRAGYTPLGQAAPTLTVAGVNAGSFYASGNCLLLAYRNPDNTVAYRGYLHDASTKAIYVLKSVLTTAPSSCLLSDSAWNPVPVTDPLMLTVNPPTTPPSSASAGTSANAVFQADAGYAKLIWIHFTLTSTNLKTQGGNFASRDIEAAVTLRN
ncbi:PilW family protein [Aeromonas caviae]|uniref:PilW family protein n=1 Tax=Aeromonas caviae TaxID=648 RepID=UPI00244C38D4|nr:prepilin-type N-terminal cleavage/methylation domain-containing protein [Aeromonas caviae]MDH1221771.1 prepilin-type N-terminal cleavage/methylation domain-containing protein [Aeromonas caviae]MDT8955290.1 prepilin-type N-terminal cleavage/methylation domain-containing protein [Aeromonas caviae]